MKFFAGMLLCFAMSTSFSFSQTEKKKSPPATFSANIKTGSEQTERYLNLLKNKKIALCINQSSVINNVPLIDTLKKLKVNIVKIFTPEHGFRGDLDAGEKVSTYNDVKTGLPIISLYDNHLKPTAGDLKGIDLVIFDIQDVGVRFYTFISTMTYVMEACAENNVEMLVLDRPNPNGFYTDGPVLEKKYSSFVGLHPVPIVHGMTVAEYARMVNGEKWLKDSVQCRLYYVPCKNYTHKSFYKLTTKPSPNLPNIRSIYLYPSLCLFEGTVVSVGRGTDLQFQVIGFPEYKKGNYTFTPRSKPGAKYPLYHNKECNGLDLSEMNEKQFQQAKKISLKWLMEMYKNAPDKKKFFNKQFNYLAGNDELKQQITEGKSEEEIRSSWKKDLEKFKKIRKKYLLYKDF